MRILREWIHRLWGTLLPRRRDSDLEQELRLHLELGGCVLQKIAGARIGFLCKKPLHRIDRDTSGTAPINPFELELNGALGEPVHVRASCRKVTDASGTLLKARLATLTEAS